VRSDQLDPEGLGLQLAPITDLAGGDLATNKAILEAVLQGRGSRAQTDVVALNAALVLWAAGLTDSVAAGVSQAQQALASGAGWQALERLRDALPAPVAG
jgi:anthranilate phosphoribosyltransferase